MPQLLELTFASHLPRKVLSRRSCVSSVLHFVVEGPHFSLGNQLNFPCGQGQAGRCEKCQAIRDVAHLDPLDNPTVILLATALQQ
jgi:hypothetical protein